MNLDAGPPTRRAQRPALVPATPAAAPDPVHALRVGGQQAANGLDGGFDEKRLRRHDGG